TASRCLPQVLTFAIRSSKFIVLHLVHSNVHGKGSAGPLQKPIPVKTITRSGPAVKHLGKKAARAGKKARRPWHFGPCRRRRGGADGRPNSNEEQTFCPALPPAAGSRAAPAGAFV